MKNGLLIILLVFFLAMSCSAYTSSPQTGYPPGAGGQYNGDPQQYNQQYGQQYGENMDMESMYNYLAPYGNWVNLDPYGYVWTPRNMGYQWRPYSDGHWVMTEDGWTWISNEEWGAIPFHYGRWGYDDYIGWYWVPGTTWGPAWVSWRGNDQYTGWAPLQPGIEIRANMDFGSISINIPIRFWNFLQTSHFLDSNVNNYTLPYERNGTLVNFTNDRNNYNFRNNRFYNGGVAADVVRRATRRDIPQYTIQDIKQPGRARLAGKNLQIYRPNLKLNAAAKPKAFLKVDEARQVLAPVKVFEPNPKLPLSVQTAAVRKRQADEEALLLKTQAQDLRDLQLKRDAQLLKIRDNAEKVRIKQEDQAKIVELQKLHQAEKLQLTERHKKDLVVVQEVAKKHMQVKQIKTTTVKTTTVKKKKGGKG